MSAMEDSPQRRYVTVCDECLRATCWHGLFMCDKAINAGTIDLDVRYLEVRALEHPSYWTEAYLRSITE